MITVLQGAPGHGKSYTLVREVAKLIHRGTTVATNVPLREDWPRVMAEHYTPFPRFNRSRVERKERAYRKLVFISDDVDELLKCRVAGKGEGRAVLIWDEFHRQANARVNRTSEARLKLIDYVSAHRHYGLDVILATQDEKNVDTQIRGLQEYLVTVRNMKRTPWLQVFIWFNLFLWTRVWNDKAKTKAGTSLYALNKKLARLYDTHAYAEYDWPDEPIILGANLLTPGEPFPKGKPTYAFPHRHPMPKPDDDDEPSAPVPIRRRKRPGDEVRDSYAR